MDGLVELFEMARSNSSGFIQSILLILIWLNVRSLKLAMLKLEEGHDQRIATLEVKTKAHEDKISFLEKSKEK